MTPFLVTARNRTRLPHRPGGRGGTPCGRCTPGASPGGTQHRRRVTTQGSLESAETKPQTPSTGASATQPPSCAVLTTKQSSTEAAPEEESERAFCGA